MQYYMYMEGFTIYLIDFWYFTFTIVLSPTVIL